MDIGVRYIIRCKLNFQKGITPSGIDSKNDIDYLQVYEIAEEYIEINGINMFSNFLMGDQYFVALWTAHIILEKENQSEKLVRQCLDTIIGYANNPLDIKVSEEERNWLKKNN